MPRASRKDDAGTAPRKSRPPEIVTPAQQALRELVRSNGLFRGLAELHFTTYGVSLAQWSVLRTLARLERRRVLAPQMKELCSEMIVGAPSLSATLHRMERSGLIRRAGDPKDKRAKNVTLARAGRQLLDRRITDHLLWIEGMMAGLSRRQQESLSRLLAKTSQHMQSLFAAQSPTARSSDAQPAAGTTRARHKEIAG